MYSIADLAGVRCNEAGELFLGQVQVSGGGAAFAVDKGRDELGDYLDVVVRVGREWMCFRARREVPWRH